MQNFFKYQGAGNDFIIIDDRDRGFDADNTKVINRLCDRRFGIGADGLMLLRAHPDHDFEMLYFNADGHPGSMCGNGGRCMVAFAYHLGIFKGTTRFLAPDGVHTAVLSGSDGQVRLEMGDVSGIRKDGDAFVLDTGSPHYVLQVEDLSSIDIKALAHPVRYSERYAPGGLNVNFVSPSGEGLAIRTYERGVEDETLACGTGATAAAIAMAHARQLRGAIRIPVKARGGDLTIYFDSAEGDTFNNIQLEGPAEFVFEGRIDLARLR